MLLLVCNIGGEGWGHAAPARPHHDDRPDLDEDLGEGAEAARGLGLGRVLAVAHVDDVRAAVEDGSEGALQARARLHAAEARVADLERDDLRAGRDAAEVRVARVVRGDDARDVRAVRARVRDDGDGRAAVVDVDGVGEERLGVEHAPLALGAKVREGGRGGEVTVAARVERRAPPRAVVPRDDVVDAAAVLLLERGG